MEGEEMEGVEWWVIGEIVLVAVLVFAGCVGVVWLSHWLWGWPR
jgi:hypothetical protein